MNLPNGERAEISMQKLTGYCLNLEHTKGKHKARVFQSALGITIENADVLRKFIEIAAVEGEVVQQSNTEFGQLFKVDWNVPNTNVEMRTLWEVTLANPNPRLVSAFVKD